MSKEFNEALGNFINDFASGGAIRHLTDMGYTVDEIVERLDYPTPRGKVAEKVFNHYLDTGRICLERPEDEIEEVTFVKEYGQFGKSTLRKVVKKISIDCDDYVACDYGKLIYQNKIEQEIELLPDRLKKHILSLPWPLERVWIRRDLW